MRNILESFRLPNGLRHYLAALAALCLLTARVEAMPPACDAAALQPVKVTDEITTSVGCAIEIDRVARGTTSLAEARSRYADGLYTPLGAKHFAFGLVPHAFWLTFDIHNPQSNPLSIVILSLIHI